LEASVNRNFNGNLINCMSCSNDHILNTLSTAVMRSSDDFFPLNPKSHGVHVFTNAFASMFMGEFLVCDWDMFQTKHEFGKFHAASRAISGSPVYVSDRVGEHDFDIIEKLTMADSVLPLCTHNARPTADSLFVDSEERNEIFKIFNYNVYTGVIGAFNLTSDIELSKTVSPCDVDGFDSGEYVVYDAKNNKLIKMTYNDTVEFSLKPIDFNIFTVTKIEDGIAPIGLTDKYNCGGTITFFEKNPNSVELKTGDGGSLSVYSERKPEKVFVNDSEHLYEYCGCELKIELENKQINKVYIEF
ncbi:MAG: Sip1-related alpha-galactosidase, partial [Clostridia bacterium]|nr:Sip1-related alpha-galactosidase [Clostridia bacterium]